MTWFWSAAPAEKDSVRNSACSLSSLARFAAPRSISGLVAFVTGVVSVFSSERLVVLPAFLPLVPGLVAKVAGGNPLAIASSILIGGNLVDVSPLSTIRAAPSRQCPCRPTGRLLFKQLLAWGFVDVGRGGGRVLLGLQMKVFLMSPEPEGARPR